MFLHWDAASFADNCEVKTALVANPLQSVIPFDASLAKYSQQRRRLGGSRVNRQVCRLGSYSASSHLLRTFATVEGRRLQNSDILADIRNVSACETQAIGMFVCELQFAPSRPRTCPKESQ